MKNTLEELNSLRKVITIDREMCLKEICKVVKGYLSLFHDNCIKSFSGYYFARKNGM